MRQRAALEELEEIADQLYSRSPAEFTAARNAEAREAREAGNAELADALRRMHKPTVAAWLANLLVRERPREVADLVALGTALRKAQAAFDGEALRHLSAQRHDVVGGLSRDARRLAAERGQSATGTVVRDLEETLEAALYDPSAAEQLERGRLTGALAYSGIGFPSTGAVRSNTRRKRAPESAGGAGGAGVKEVAHGSALRQAQHDARDARRAAERAATALATAERASAREKDALSAAETELARRREATRAVQRAVARARADRDAAEREARRAEQRVEAVRRRTSRRATT